MSRFSNLESTIEWESVRKNKNPKKASEGGGQVIKPIVTSSGGTDLPKKVPDEINENYVPRTLRDDLDNILYSSDSVNSKIQNLYKKVNEFIRIKKSRDIDWKTRLNIYIIHRVCKMNKQEILSSIIDHSGDVNKYVNAISSTKSGNTCLFDAVYYGSDQCINILLNRGANIRHVNKAGETIYDLLETGREDNIRRHPGKDIFINNRYDDCLRLIKATDEEREREKEKALAKSGGGEGQESQPEPEPKLESELESKSEKTKFRSEYDEESLKEDFTKYIENIQEFKNFIKHIKETLHLDDLLKTIIEDEDIDDLMVDNPFARNIV